MPGIVGVPAWGQQDALDLLKLPLLFLGLDPAGARPTPAQPGRGAGFAAAAAGRGMAAPGRGAPPMGGRGAGRTAPMAGPPGQPRPAAPGTASTTLPVPKEDFDFGAALEKFNKEALAKVGGHGGWGCGSRQRLGVHSVMEW